jgi:hypothetical protein
LLDGKYRFGYNKEVIVGYLAKDKNKEKTRKKGI